MLSERLELVIGGIGLGYIFLELFIFSKKMYVLKAEKDQKKKKCVKK